MKFCLFVVGPTTEGFVLDGLAFYTARIARMASFEVVAVDVPKRLQTPDVAQQRQREAAVLLPALAKVKGPVILLDEKGKMPTTNELAVYIDKRFAGGAGQINFVVGGAYGFDKEVYEYTTERLALSRLTMPHQLVRLVFVEQLYRVLTVLKNLPYHHA